VISFPFRFRALAVLAFAGSALAPAPWDTPATDRPSVIAVQMAPASVTLDPQSGSAGTLVTIRGTSVGNASKVLFSPDVEADFTVADVTTIRAFVPAGAKSGPVQVVTPTATLKSLEPFQVPNE
jgi:hypothetical protein